MWRTNRSQCAKISPILAVQSQNPLVSTKKSLWEWVKLALPTGNFRKDCGETDMLPSGLNVRYIVLLCSVHSSAMQRLGPYTSHSLLLRRFVFRNVEASDWWWTARDHGKGTDCRRSDVWPVVSFPPSFARTFSSRERRVGTRQYQSQVKKLQAYMMRHLREVINISWKGKITNKVSLEKADLPPMADILIQMNLRRLCHVERMDFVRVSGQLLYS